MEGLIKWKGMNLFVTGKGIENCQIYLNEIPMTGTHSISIKIIWNGPIFLGVSGYPFESIGNQAWIGSDIYPLSWSYWDTGTKCNDSLPTSYGPQFEANSVITIIVNRELKTLSFEKDGEDLGKAFDLPEISLYFAISMT